MKLRQLFDIAIEAGIESDPRSKDTIRKELKRVDERHKRMEGKEREHIDHERTWNPYLDSRILNGTGKEEVKYLMIGIDIETSELLLADELRRRGTKIDAVMCHHPEGRALADLEKVMHVQIDVLAKCGVAENRAEGLLRPRMDKIWRNIHADNLFRVERAAELLDIPFFGCHTITDNLVWAFMEKEICQKKFDSVGEIMNALLEIPEYAAYAKKGNPPILVNGNKEGRPGKIFANEFTGGTNGPEELMKLQAEAGVGTVLSMHATEKTLEIAKEHNVNIIQCSHMASDALGVNLLVDIWQKKGAKLHILPISGYIRVERKGLRGK
ncbi:MAG TPA: hypothetical protein VJB82_03695 [Candidatus Peribacterales bacterium]|nr:hypothetical protein [Candidatus Peribacterales bacterium]